MSDLDYTTRELGVHVEKLFIELQAEVRRIEESVGLEISNALCEDKEGDAETLKGLWDSVDPEARQKIIRFVFGW